MSNLQLIIGDKNYSTWSLRAWLLLKGFEIDFDEQPIELFEASAKPILEAYSPTGKVPVLVHFNDNEGNDKNNGEDKNNDKAIVWDTLAIANYANDYLTDKDIWSGLLKSELARSELTKLNGKPSFAVNKARAYCQSIVAEMHSGLLGVRSEMPMNIRATARIEPSAACLADLARIEAIFSDCLQGRADDSYLFGEFTVADAFFSPIVLRLQTYAKASGIALQPMTKQYSQTILNNAYVQQWREAALDETHRIEQDEAGEILSLVGALDSAN